MASLNPRPELMAQLKGLCRNFEKKVNDLDIETRAILNCNRASGNGAAAEWVQEVRSLHSEVDTTMSTVTESRSNMESFLGEMKTSLRSVMEDTAKMQEFMAQYGYKPQEMDIEAMLEWDEKIEEDPLPQMAPAEVEEEELLEDIAPPNASEFGESTEQRDSETARKSSVEEEKSAVVKTSIESPSIFDIGLSKYGMSLVLGKDLPKSVTKQQPASRSPELTPKILFSKPRTDSPRSPAIPNLTSILNESKYEGSPVLKLNTRPFNANIDDSTVDITPGLPSRKKPQSVGRRAGAQELPTLAKQHLMPRAACLGDSPEMPEFTSNFVKAMAMGKDKVQLRPSRPTPEFPELSFLKNETQNVTQTRTPESPELTMVYKTLKNLKP